MKNINSLPREIICSQRSCEKPRPSEQPFCRVVGFNRIFPWGAGRNFTFVESADKTQRQTQRRGGARLQRGEANTSTASKATTTKVTRVATTTATRVATTTATAAVAAAMRMMEADNYTDPSQRSDGPFAPQKRRLRTRTPSDAEGLGEHQRPRRPVSNRTTTQSNRAPLGLPDGTARIFGVHGTEQHACPYYRAWESRCHWSVPLSPAAPLPRRGPRVGRLLILGDSLDAQLFAAVACNLYAHRGPDLQLEFEATWENGIAALKKRCDSLNRCHYTSATLRVHSANQARVPFRTMHLCQDSRVDCLRKLNFDPATDVVATGLDALHGAAHGARGMFVRRVMNATVAAIEARKDARRVLDLVPNQRLIWREATAQHFPALGGHWLHGFMLRTNIEQLDQRCAHHPLAEMIRHAHWNPAAEPLVRAAGVPVLRTWMASAKAWYAHTDHGDCTHFCQPGLLSTAGRRSYSRW